MCELPTCDNCHYKKFSNPFVRTYKKNIKLYKTIFEENNNEILEGIISDNIDDDFELIRKYINDYQNIEDSGNLFEAQLLENLSVIDYIKSEYLLNISNYNQNLNEFQDGYKNFKNLFANKLNENKTINCFKFKNIYENNFIRKACPLSYMENYK